MQTKSPDHSLLKKVEEVSTSVLNEVRRESYAGYDPFDGLNSVLFKFSQLHRVPFFRLAWLQLNKRSPINLRPFFLVPKRRNPKGVGLFISGLVSEYYATGNQSLLTEAAGLADWLLDNMADQGAWGYPCWGYHFDWQAKAFFVPAGKPNVITTVYVARALYALAEVLEPKEGERFRQAAVGAAYFIHSFLLTDIDSKTPFVAYIPGETAFVHNASLWGAAWMVFSGVKLDDNRLIEDGLKVCRRSVAEQAEDGSWVYGAMAHHQFIDGFHTGYNLEALDLVRKSVETSEFDNAIDRGLKFYGDNFFLEDGTPKYYHDKVFPIDMHSSAQAVITFLKLQRNEDDLKLVERVLTWTLKNTYMPKNCQFVYQITPRYTNKINYMRWTQAWAFYALTNYQEYMARRLNEGS